MTVASAARRLLPGPPSTLLNMTQHYLPTHNHSSAGGRDIERCFQDRLSRVHQDLVALSPLVPQPRIPRAGFISLCRYLLHQVEICILLRPRRQQIPRALRAAA